MRIALTGATGFIGSRTARMLREDGHEVVALVREGSRREHLQTAVSRYAVGDQADARAWGPLLDGADAVVHAAADWEALRSGDLRLHLRANVEASVLLLHAAIDAGITRFVFLSSVAVHHAISPRWGGLIDEDHPTRPGSLYGAYKAAVEAHLFDAHAWKGMHTVSIRPSAVYGVEPVNIQRSHGYKQAERLLRGERVTREQFPGGGKFVHVDDVALATVRAVERAEMADVSGKTFTLADCYAKFTRFAEHGAAVLGLPPDRVEPDPGPPARNMFDKTPTREALGVALDRGDDGLRAHMAALLAVMRGAGGPEAS